MISGNLETGPLFPLLHRLFILGCFILLTFPALTVKADDDWGDFDDDYWDDDPVLIADPFEPFNRAMFEFNDRVYFMVLKPVARVYRHVPEPIRVSTSNFFSNLRAPIRITNSLLQLRLVDAGNELLRFGVNTTVGVGGLFDPARNYLGIREKREDFGQTLGHYGVGHGFYLVMPLFGPTSLRDGTGSLLDTYFLDPIVVLVDDEWVTLSLYTLDGINELSLDRDTYESVKRDALDPYTFIRDAYAQRRAAEVAR